jgi:hypothetical protein
MSTCQFPNLNTPPTTNLNTPPTTPKDVILDALKCGSINSKHISSIVGVVSNNINAAILQISIDDFNAALTESRSWVGSTTLRDDLIMLFKIHHPGDADKVRDNSFTTSFLGRGGKKSRKYRKRVSIACRWRNESNKKRKSSRVRRR